VNPFSVLLVLSSVLLVVGVIVAVVPVDPPDPQASAATTSGFNTNVAIRAAWATALGVVILAVSGWVLPALIVATAAWYWVRAFQRRDRSGQNDVERTDALASWIENLRDVLLAGDQPVGAIAATVPTAAPSIRPAVRRLSVALGHQDPDTAFRRFAVQRGARTAAVLTSLAEQARVGADRRRIVDAERAPIQREVTLLSLIMGSLLMVLLVFGRSSYLAAYDTGGGQLFLGAVLATYAALLLRVQQLSRFPKPARFLTTAGRGAPHTPPGTRR
jgi:hypothetical protein